MPELLVELFSEEIPARMQARAAEDLARLLADALKPAGLVLEGVRSFHGPRRIALSCTLPAATAAVEEERRGPRADATGPALEGFLRATGLPREGLEERDTGKGVYLYAVIRRPGRPTAELLAEALPALLRRFPWPKSMRWGDGSGFTWVRPLQRILCVFDGAAVPFALAAEGDDGHGLRTGEKTEGHRILSPGAFAARDAASWEAGLRERHVVADAAEREALIERGVAELATAEGLEVVPDRGLLAEVAGLVEWPVPLLGRIDDAFMDLPAEVMRTSMRVNQRYFALRHRDGRAANRFALVANIPATDGGAKIIAGNERVLRARLSDARFFWDNDRKAGLESFLPKLEGVTFHAKLGTQAQRVERIVALARHLAPLVGADTELAARAAKLCKADLASGMVGEFPELQGVMGGYYAREAGLDPRIADAIAQHYRPLGPTDAVPSEPMAVAVALADKLDTLAGFFAVGEKPTGSGDPFALRRAALGVIRIIRENELRLPLRQVFAAARPDAPVGELLDFLLERLRVQLRAEGQRHDVVAASIGSDDDLTRILARGEALKALLDTEDGANLLAAYKRAANILRIEEKKDGRAYSGPVNAGLLAAPEEAALDSAIAEIWPLTRQRLDAEDFAGATGALARLRAPVDAFFDKVVVNAEDPQLRVNRLLLLSSLRAAADQVAELSKIEA
ncbi:glycine--tRNA ligase subunit beta [Sabulicella glaciei]|uniref:Glycine--tRNA ligase beta subunit n=1 Tax=Sabulicella glaciei TaxID=2984948 RepID=A0ABT3NVT6_9PROT|nr:glycine--tRNA ligase subunit beta [Roseococcus sp. MDT2-1-1]MCW8086236.1 glycine--tRNA ligase subunit beta [Roseococcus sp. MDT2-1-1]